MLAKRKGGFDLKLIFNGRPAYSYLRLMMKIWTVGHSTRSGEEFKEIL